jgi:5-methylcytosine-specific restriction endonuclease McrA
MKFQHGTRLATEKRFHRPPVHVPSAMVLDEDMATKTDYAQQLLHPNWQRKRLEVLQDAEFHCERCGDGESTLHVHHKHYVKGRKAWEYTRHELSALCETCHQAEHDKWPARSALLAMLDVDGPYGIDKFLAYGAGAIAAWGVPPHLQAMFADLAKDSPRDFAMGFLAERLSLSMLTVNVDALAKAADTPAFVADVAALMRKHGLAVVDEPWLQPTALALGEFGA